MLLTLGHLSSPNINNLRIRNQVPQYFFSALGGKKNQIHLLYFRSKSGITVIKHLQIKFQCHPILTSPFWEKGGSTEDGLFIETRQATILRSTPQPKIIFHM